MDLIVRSQLPARAYQLFQKEVLPLVDLAFRRYPALAIQVKAIIQHKHFQKFRDVCGRKEVYWAAAAFATCYIAMKVLNSEPAKNAWMGVLKWTISYLSSLIRVSQESQIPHSDDVAALPPILPVGSARSETAGLSTPDLPPMGGSDSLPHAETGDNIRAPISVPAAGPPLAHADGFDGAVAFPHGETVVMPRSDLSATVLAPYLDEVRAGDNIGDLMPVSAADPSLADGGVSAGALDFAHVPAAVILSLASTRSLETEGDVSANSTHEGDVISRRIELGQAEMQQEIRHKQSLLGETFSESLRGVSSCWNVPYTEKCAAINIQIKACQQEYQALISADLAPSVILERLNDLLQTMHGLLQEKTAILHEMTQFDQSYNTCLSLISEYEAALSSIETLLARKPNLDLQRVVIAHRKIKDALHYKMRHEVTDHRGIRDVLAEIQTNKRRFSGEKTAAAIEILRQINELEHELSQVATNLSDSEINEVVLEGFIDQLTQLNGQAQLHRAQLANTHRLQLARDEQLLLDEMKRNIEVKIGHCALEVDALREPFQLLGDSRDITRKLATLQAALQKALELDSLKSILTDVEQFQNELNAVKVQLKADLQRSTTQLSTTLGRSTTLVEDSLTVLSEELRFLQKLNSLRQEIEGQISTYTQQAKRYNQAVDVHQLSDRKSLSVKRNDALKYRPNATFTSQLRDGLKQGKESLALSDLKQQISEEMGVVEALEITLKTFEERTQALERQLEHDMGASIASYRQTRELYNRLKQLVTELESVITRKHSTYVSHHFEGLPHKLPNKWVTLDLSSRQLTLTTGETVSLDEMDRVASRCQTYVLSVQGQIEQRIEALHQKFPGLQRFQSLHPVSSALAAAGAVPTDPATLLTLSQEMFVFLMRYDASTLTPALFKRWLDMCGIQYGERVGGQVVQQSWFRDDFSFSVPMIPFAFVQGDLDRTHSIQDIRFVFTFTEDTVNFPSYKVAEYSHETHTFKDIQKTWNCYEVACQIYGVQLYLEKFLNTEESNPQVRRQVAFDLWKEALNYLDVTCTDYLENTTIEQATDTIHNTLSIVSTVSSVFCCCRRQKRIDTVARKEALKVKLKSAKEMGLRDHVVYPILKKIPKLLNITGIVTSTFVAPLCIGAQRFIYAFKYPRHDYSRRKDVLENEKKRRALSDIEHIEWKACTIVDNMQWEEIQAPNRKDMPDIDALLASGQDVIDAKMGYTSTCVGAYEIRNVYQVYMLYGKTLIGAKKYLQGQIIQLTEFVNIIDGLYSIKGKTEDEQKVYDGLKGSIAFYQTIVSMVDRLITSDKAPDDDTLGSVMEMVEPFIKDAIKEFGVHKVKAKYRQGIALSLNLLTSILAFGGVGIFNQYNEEFSEGIFSLLLSDKDRIADLVKGVKYGNIAYTGQAIAVPTIKVAHRFGDMRLVTKMETAWSEIRRFPKFQDIIQTTGVGEKQLQLFFNLIVRGLSLAEGASRFLDHFEFALDTIIEHKGKVRGAAFGFAALEAWANGKGIAGAARAGLQTYVGHSRTSRPQQMSSQRPALMERLPDPINAAERTVPIQIPPNMPTVMAMEALFDGQDKSDQSPLAPVARRVGQALAQPIQQLHGLPAQARPIGVSRVITTAVMGSYLLALIFFMIIFIGPKPGLRHGVCTEN